MSIRVPGLLGLLLATLSGPASAQQFVTELDTGPALPHITAADQLVPGNGVVYFRGIFPDSGTEIGVTDGTVAGTRVFADLLPGPDGSSSIPLGLAGSSLFFSSGSNLGITDGTPAGTRTFRANVSATFPQVRYVGSVALRYLWLQREAYVGPWRLYSSDGTSAGTIQIANMFGFRDAVERNGLLLIADDTGNGVLQLYATNGTAVTPIATLPTVGRSPFASIGQYDYFVVEEPSGEWVLWRTDGTTTGTTAVRSIGQRQVECSIARFGSQLAIATGAQVWISDGTTAGTSALPIFLPGAKLATTAGNVVIFAATEVTTGQQLLWRTDGTAAGTSVINSIPMRFSHSVAAGANAFFVTDEVQARIVRTDGTPANTFVLQGAQGAGDRMLAPLGNDAITTVQPSHISTTRGQIFKTDCTPAGTVQLTASATPAGIWIAARGVELASTLFFTAATEGTAHRAVLWRTDGTTAGTQQVSGAPPGVGPVRRFRGAVWFTALGSIWRHDGGAGPSVQVLQPDPTATRSSLIEVTDDYLVFTTTTSSNAPSVWRSDGTAAGTVLLYNGLAGEVVDSAVQIGSATFFLQHWSSSTGRIFRSAGTQSSTTFLSSSTRWMGRLGERVVFSLPGGDIHSVTSTSTGAAFVGLAPWVPSASYPVGSGLVCIANALGAIHTDGIATVTVLPVPAPRSAAFAADGLVYMVANDAQGQPALLRTDGTVAGTTVALSLGPGPLCNLLAAEPIGAGNRIFLSASDGVSGCEPWISQGTQGATSLLADLVPGGSSTPQWLGTAGEKAYFVAFDPVRGRELWSFDLAAVGAANAQPFGVGCPGTNGIPRLAVDGMPAIGRTLSLRLQRGAASSLGLLFVGLGPQRLAVGGGCEFLMTTVVWSDLVPTDAAGSATTSLAVPNDPVFVGLQVVAQAACLDAAAPSGLGFTGSEGVLLVLGG